MKVRNAIAKVKAHFKKQGIDIQISPPTKNGSYKWSFQHDGYEGSFSVNGMSGNDPAALDGDACLFHVRGVNDHSDLQSDYFAGSFRENITQVCCSLLACRNISGYSRLCRTDTQHLNVLFTSQGLRTQEGVGGRPHPFWVHSKPGSSNDYLIS